MNEIRCDKCGLLFTPQDESGILCPLCIKSQRGKFGGSRATKEEMSNDKTRLQRAAESAISKYEGVRPAARKLGINHGILIMARDGKEVPAAYRALGVRKTERIRSCFDWGRGEEAEEARDLFNTFLEEFDYGLRGIVAEWYAENSHIAVGKIGKEKAMKLLYFMMSWDKL